MTSPGGRVVHYVSTPKDIKKLLRRGYHLGDGRGGGGMAPSPRPASEAPPLPLRERMEAALRRCRESVRPDPVIGSSSDPNRMVVEKVFHEVFPWSDYEGFFKRIVDAILDTLDKLKRNTRKLQRLNTRRADPT